jgi:hypothetical protein
MAFQISSSFPYSSLNGQSIGYPLYFYFQPNNSGWFSTQTTLPNGIYLVILNVVFKNSPNAFAYITSSTNTNSGNIPHINEGLKVQMSNLNSIDDPTWTGGAPPQPQSNYWVLADAQARNGVSGSSQSLSLSCVVEVNNNSSIGISTNSETNNSPTTIYWTITRLT